MKVRYFAELVLAASICGYSASAITVGDDECIHAKIYEECRHRKNLALKRAETKYGEKEYAETKADLPENKTEAKVEEKTETKDETKTAATITNKIPVTGLEKKLEKTLIDSGECDKIYWVSISPNKKDEYKIISCYATNSNIKENGGYSEKYTLNLNTICAAQVYKRPQFLNILNKILFDLPDYFFKDEVIVKTSDGSIISMRFKDSYAKEIVRILYDIQDNNKSICEDWNNFIQKKSLEELGGNKK